MQRRDTSLAICGKWLTTGRNGGDYICDIFHLISVATAHYRGAKSIGAAQVENYLRFFFFGILWEYFEDLYSVASIHSI